MLKKSSLRIVLLAGFIFLAACAPKALPSSITGTPTGDPHFFPTGAYVSGEWTLEFKPDGTFSWTGPSESEIGTYAAEGNQVVFTTQSCGDVKGTYRWSYDGRTPMLLKAVDDACRDRVELITSSSWWFRP